MHQRMDSQRSLDMMNFLGLQPKICLISNKMNVEKGLQSLQHLQWCMDLNVQLHKLVPRWIRCLMHKFTTIAFELMNCHLIKYLIESWIGRGIGGKRTLDFHMKTTIHYPMAHYILGLGAFS